MQLTADLFKENFGDLMISLEDLGGQGYPLDYQRIDQKTEPVIEKLSHLAGCKVLEIGSNFGMYSLLMSSIAAEVIGLEIDRRNLTVSQRIRLFFETKGYQFDNVDIREASAIAAQSIDYNGVLLTLVLYHLDDQEIDALIEDFKIKCNKMVIQCRPGRFFASKRGSFTGHVSRTTRFDGLYDIAGNIQFMETIGLKNIRVTVNAHMLGQEVFPVIIGER